MQLFIYSNFLLNVEQQHGGHSSIVLGSSVLMPMICEPLYQGACNIANGQITNIITIVYETYLYFAKVYHCVSKAVRSAEEDTPQLWPLIFACTIYVTEFRIKFFDMWRVSSKIGPASDRVTSQTPVWWTGVWQRAGRSLLTHTPGAMVFVNNSFRQRAC